MSPTLAQSKERKGSNFAIWQPWAQVPDGHGGHGHGSGHGHGDHGEREHKEHHKTQAVRSVQAAAMNRCFQSLYSLLGYNEVERRFQVSVGCWVNSNF